MDIRGLKWKEAISYLEGKGLPWLLRTSEKDMEDLPSTEDQLNETEKGFMVMIISPDDPKMIVTDFRWKTANKL